MRYILAHRQARENAARAVLEAPEGYLVRITEPTRNLEQNAKLHALLSDISREQKWHGEYLDIEDWKRLLVAAWQRATQQPAKIVKALDGFGVDVLYKRTSTLTKSECAELIDYIEAWREQTA